MNSLYLDLCTPHMLLAAQLVGKQKHMVHGLGKDNWFPAVLSPISLLADWKQPTLRTVDSIIILI